MAADRWRQAGAVLLAAARLAVGGPSSSTGDVPLVEQGAARAAIVKSPGGRLRGRQLRRVGIAAISSQDIERPHWRSALGRGSRLAIVLETAGLARLEMAWSATVSPSRPAANRCFSPATPTAVLYAVYTLLETLGGVARPGEQGEILPRLRSVSSIDACSPPRSTFARDAHL